MSALNPDYSKRDCSLPPGCKDLIDVIQQRETAKWKTFFDSYRKLAYDAAREAGLTDGEAQEVVQDLIKAIAEKTPKLGDHAAGDPPLRWVVGRLGTIRERPGWQFESIEGAASVI